MGCTRAAKKEERQAPPSCRLHQHQPSPVAKLCTTDGIGRPANDYVVMNLDLVIDALQHSTPQCLDGDKRKQ